MTLLIPVDSKGCYKRRVWFYTHYVKIRFYVPLLSKALYKVILQSPFSIREIEAQVRFAQSHVGS